MNVKTKLRILKRDEKARSELHDALSKALSWGHENSEPLIKWNECPRCGGESKINAPFPYCPDCNWDSLHDQSWSHEA